jgi:hypothetical protein
MTARFYAGIGSRQTPAPVLRDMALIAAALAERGWTLRSGHAEGADLAFERGAASAPVAGHVADVFLPWPSFNSHAPRLDGVRYFERPAEWTFGPTRNLHPAPDRLTPAGLALHARNLHQLRGAVRDDAAKSAFVVCWTRDGAQRSLDCSRHTGGTGQAIRIAQVLGVPVFNLARPASRRRVMKGLGLL